MLALLPHARQAPVYGGIQVVKDSFTSILVNHDSQRVYVG